MGAAISFDARFLRAALEATFAARGPQPLPIALPPPPAAREAPYRVLAREVGLPPNVATGFRSVAAFLDPLLAGGLDGRARRDAAAGAWGSGSP